MGPNWDRFADLHRRIRPPLRPTSGDVAAMRGALAGRDRRLVMLGVTPELAGLGHRLTAFDGSFRMVRDVWPGDRDGRHALVADWLALPVAGGSVDAVVGDGSLNAAPKILPAVLAEIRRVLRPDGVAVFRTFCRPEAGESLEQIADDIARGWVGNFHALKWRIAMTLATETQGHVDAAAVRHGFDRLYPDRAALSAATGWPAEEIATIDNYEGATHGFLFPTEHELWALASPQFASVAVLPASGYVLAERCPLIVMGQSEGPNSSS